MQINEILQNEAHIWVVLSDDMESGIFFPTQNIQASKKVILKGINLPRGLTKNLRIYITINPFYFSQRSRYSYRAIE